MTTVRDLIEDNATWRPRATYAVSAEMSATAEAMDGGRMSFAELGQACRRVAGLLQRLGSQPGDVVSLVMPNGLSTMRLLLGAMHGGWCVNPVDLLAQPQQMQHALQHSESRVVFVAPEWEARVRELTAIVQRPLEIVVVPPDDGAWLAEATVVETSLPAPGTLALLMYTSGTVGVPKGVMLTHGNLAAAATAASAEHGLTPEDRVLGVLPLCHINAFVMTMLAPLAHGGGVALASKFSVARFWTQVAEHRCTWLDLVPAIVSYLLESEAPPAQTTAAIRFCRSASAPLAPEMLRAFETRFGIGIVETMGLTETAAPSFSNPLDAAQRKLGSLGRASGGEARVVDDRLQPIADGCTGEIVVRGPQVTAGYFRDEAATRLAFTPDGWLRTGDLGHRDADGFFFVTGRIEELIIKGGENIAPREIDEVLMAHPAVREAAATGMPDFHYGQEILACVVPRPGLRCTEAALRAFCLERLGAFKTPRVIRIVDELPRGPSGKVQRLKLAEASALGTAANGLAANGAVSSDGRSCADASQA